jgi:hypothetical protein
LGLWNLGDGDTEIGKIDGRILWRRTLQKDNGDFKMLERLPRKTGELGTRESASERKS